MKVGDWAGSSFRCQLAAALIMTQFSLVPSVSHLAVPGASEPGDGKMRDPGNEVGRNSV